MRAHARFFSRLQYYIFRIPIFKRTLIANSTIILIGAICGTIITRKLTLLGDFKLILLFASLGIGLSLLVNYWVIKTTAQPIHQLRHTLEQVKEGQVAIPETVVMRADPDIHQLVEAINSMLIRLDRHTRQLRALSERAINAQEEERKRIARGLHDDTAQAISTLIIQLERLENLSLEHPEQVPVKLALARQLATRMLEDLRKNMWDLRPSILDDLGLVPAIRWYVGDHLQESGILVNLDGLSDGIRLPAHLETMLFRVIQEAVSNILRHSSAKTVAIRLKQVRSSVCLEVEDNGRGFDVEQASGEAVTRKQLGLLGIQERAALAGGEVKINSSPGRGTSLLVCVPKGGIFEDSTAVEEAFVAQ